MPESKGVEEVYAGRVDYVKAITSLQNAQVKLKEAQVASENAMTKQVEAQVKAQEIRNALLESTSQREKDQYTLDLARIKVENERNLMNTQVNLTRAQATYQDALALLELALKYDVPTKYQSKLSDLRSKLSTSAATIAYDQSILVGYKLAVESYDGKDSLNIVSNLTMSITNAQKQLKASQEVLTLAQAAKNGDLDAIVASLDAKIAVLTAEKASVKVKVYNAQEAHRTLNVLADGYYFDLYNKSDYKTFITISAVVKVGFMDFYVPEKGRDNNNNLNSDGTSYSYVGTLNGVIAKLKDLLSFVNGKITANPNVAGWAVLKTSVSVELDRFTAMQDELNKKISNLDYQSISNSLISLSRYQSIVESSLSSLISIRDNMKNNQSGLDGNILDAKNALNSAVAELKEAQASFDTFKTTGVAFWKGSTSPFVKGIRDAIAARTIKIADEKAKFDMLNKEKDALLAAIGK